MEESLKYNEDDAGPPVSANDGKLFSPGKNILEVREVMVGNDGERVIPLPGSLFFRDWDEIKEYACRDQGVKLKRRIAD